VSAITPATKPLVALALIFNISVPVVKSVIEV